MNCLVTESLEKVDVSYVLQFNKRLLTKLELQWVDWIHGYMLKFGTPPTLARFEKEFANNFSPVFSGDPLEDIFQQTFVEKRNIFVRSTISNHAQKLKDGADPMPLIEMMYEAIEGADSTCVVSDTWDKSNYFRTDESLLSGFRKLDEVTGGFVRGDLTYIAGRPGDGKTTLLIHFIAKWYMLGKKILLISNEIPYDDMMFKIDGVLADIKVSEKRTNKWLPESKQKIMFLQYLASIAPGKIITPKGPVTNPSQVRAYIKQHKPDVVCIDGAYLMSPNGKPTTDWGELAAASRELKQIANQERTRIIGVLQRNRLSEQMSNASVSALGGTDAYGQDADTVLLLTAQGKDGDDKEVLLTTSKNRNGVVTALLLRYDFDRQVIYESED